MSKEATKKHIGKVQKSISDICSSLEARAVNHDSTKLVDPELKGFDKYTPKLKASVYNSDEYYGYLDGLSAVLKHHYSHNKHHPQHWNHRVCSYQFF